MTNDLISRQAAIDYFVTNVGFHDEDGYPIEDSDELRKIWAEYFDGIPSAQPERKKGHWIVITRHEHYPSGKPYEKLQCPFCKKFDHNGDGNFCGYCGAEMQKGENDG